MSQTLTPEPAPSPKVGILNRDATSKALAKVGNQWIDLMQNVSAKAARLQPYKDLMQKYATDYHGDLVGPIFVGLAMLLIGGQFPLTITVIEAMRLTGWEAIAGNLRLLWEDAMNFKRDSDEDDKKDEDNNGIADVREISGKELFRRKVGLFMSKPQNVERLRNSLTGLYTGVVSITATLHVEFARVVTLGSAIGNIIVEHAKTLLKAKLMAVNVPLPSAESVVASAVAGTSVQVGSISNEMKGRWIDMGLTYAGRFLGVLIAFFARRLLTALHASMRGANLVIENGDKLLQRYGIFALKDNKNLQETLVYPLALFGLYSQLVMGFTYPWLFALPLLPVTIFEKILLASITFQNPTVALAQ